MGDAVLFCLSFLRFLTASIDNVLFEPHSDDLKIVLNNWSASVISSWSPGGFTSWPFGWFASCADLLAALLADLLAGPLSDGVAPLEARYHLRPPASYHWQVRSSIGCELADHMEAEAAAFSLLHTRERWRTVFKKYIFLKRMTGTKIGDQKLP